MTHSRHLCVFCDKRVQIVDLTFPENHACRTRFIEFRGTVSAVCFHPIWMCVVAVALSDEILLFDLRFDSPLLGRRTNATMSYMTFAEDALLACSRAGWISKHALTVSEPNRAIFWAGKERCSEVSVLLSWSGLRSNFLRYRLVRSTVKMLDSPFLVVTGLVSSSRVSGRAFLLTSVGHAFEQDWSEKKNQEMLGQLTFLFLGNHDQKTEYVGALANVEFEAVEDEDVVWEQDPQMVARMLTRDESHPLVPDMDMIGVKMG